MLIADVNKMDGRTYPARRTTKNLVGGASPIQINEFCMGFVTLEPNGGQVPWHNHEQEEIYFIVEGEGEMCLGEERQTISTGQTVFYPIVGLPPVDEHWRHADADGLLLWACRRCSALETRVSRHPPKGRE